MRKFILYLKLSGISLVILIVLSFMFSNREPISVKFLFWPTPEIPKYAFMLSAMTTGALVFRVGRGIRKSLGDLKLLRREEQARKKLIQEVKDSVETKTNSQ
ncbi:MAG: hypothetical protein IID46_02350 [Planctomycetes bacterium]|nr:hypothetical protein [Planctomycetota bacterium]